MSAYRSSRFELGRLERRHSSPMPVGIMMLFFVVLGAPGLALLSGFQSGKGEIFAGDRTTNALLGVVLVALALYFTRLALRKAKLSVDVHENGLVWREGDRTRILPWSEIVALRDSHTQRTVVGAEVARTNVYRLTLASGRELLATSMLSDVTALGTRVASALERKLPELRDSIAKGRAIEFGKVTLDREGLTHEERRLSWPEISSTDVVNGTIEIAPLEGPRVAVEWSATPNARLLLTLISERTSEATTSPPEIAGR